MDLENIWLKREMSRLSIHGTPGLPHRIILLNVLTKDLIKELLFGFLFLFIELFHWFGEHFIEIRCKDHSARSLRARGAKPPTWNPGVTP